jgi:hypothetical protein
MEYPLLKSDRQFGQQMRERTPGDLIHMDVYSDATKEIRGVVIEVGGVGMSITDVRDLRMRCMIHEKDREVHDAKSVVFKRPPTWDRLPDCYLHPSQFQEVLSLQKDLKDTKEKLKKALHEAQPGCLCGKTHYCGDGLEIESALLEQEKAGGKMTATEIADTKSKILLRQQSGASRALHAPRQPGLRRIHVSIDEGDGNDEEDTYTSDMYGEAPAPTSRPASGRQPSEMLPSPATSSRPASGRQPSEMLPSESLAKQALHLPAKEVDVSADPERNLKGWLQKEGGLTAFTKSWENVVFWVSIETIYQTY